MRRIQLDLILVVLLIPIAARATDYYVSPTGSDSNSGSQASPWLTINHANGVVVAGDTVHVADGTYNVSNSGTGYYTGGVATTVSGTASARIRYVSINKWGAKIVSSGYTYNPSTGVSTGANDAWYNTGSYVDIVGFDITADGHIGILNDGSYVNELSNRIHDITAPYACNGFTGGSAGIDNANDISTASGSSANGNWIYNLGDQTNRCESGAHGVYQAVPGGTIENNLIYQVSGFGVHLYHQASNVTVLFNTIFQGVGGIVVGASVGYIDDYTNVSNNIFVDHQTWGILENGYAGDHNTYSNNVIYDNPTNLSLQSGHSATGTVSAAESTLFVNWQSNGSGNYHLKAGSPAIDAANPSYPVSTDFDGVSRPQGAGYDIGAYEYVLRPSPPTSVTVVPH